MIGAYFVYYGYLNGTKENVSVHDYVYQAKNYYNRMGKAKQINIKNRTYYFYNGIINLKNFKSNLLKVDKKSRKNIGIYNIGYITIKKN